MKKAVKFLYTTLRGEKPNNVLNVLVVIILIGLLFI